jgi:hypothetical protein
MNALPICLNCRPGESAEPPAKLIATNPMAKRKNLSL